VPAGSPGCDSCILFALLVPFRFFLYSFCTLFLLFLYSFTAYLLAQLVVPFRCAIALLKSQGSTCYPALTSATTTFILFTSFHSTSFHSTSFSPTPISLLQHHSAQSPKTRFAHLHLHLHLLLPHSYSTSTSLLLHLYLTQIACTLLCFARIRR
jgi:hypothetical protein